MGIDVPQPVFGRVKLAPTDIPSAMQKLALQQIGGLTVNYWGLPSTDRYDNRVNQIISKWKTAGDNSVNSLVKFAHACLTAQCA